MRNSPYISNNVFLLKLDFEELVLVQHDMQLNEENQQYIFF